MRGRDPSHERRVEPIIDGFGDRLHGIAAGRKSGHHLPFPGKTMIHVGREHGRRTSDLVAVCRKESVRFEGEDAIE